MVVCWPSANICCEIISVVICCAALVCDSSEGRLLDFQRHCILDFDMFHHLVSLCLSLPALYAEDESAKKQLHAATGGLNDLHALRIVFVAHIMQILTTASNSLLVDGKYELK
jgi:hypothetical protein